MKYQSEARLSLSCWTPLPINLIRISPQAANVDSEWSYKKHAKQKKENVTISKMRRQSHGKANIYIKQRGQLKQRRKETAKKRRKGKSRN